jgi:hypothetical protein
MIGFRLDYPVSRLNVGWIAQFLVGSRLNFLASDWMLTEFPGS